MPPLFCWLPSVCIALCLQPRPTVGRLNNFEKSSLQQRELATTVYVAVSRLSSSLLHRSKASSCAVRKCYAQCEPR